MNRRRAHPPPSPPESRGLALLRDRLGGGPSPLLSRVRHRHAPGGAGLPAERVARWRDAGLGLLLGVGFALGSFRVPGFAVSRRTTAFIPLAPLGVGYRSSDRCGNRLGGYLARGSERIRPSQPSSRDGGCDRRYQSGGDDRVRPGARSGGVVVRTAAPLQGGRAPAGQVVHLRRGGGGHPPPPP